MSGASLLASPLSLVSDSLLFYSFTRTFVAILRISSGNRLLNLANQGSARVKVESVDILHSCFHSTVIAGLVLDNAFGGMGH